MKRKLIVTGASGFLGYHLIRTAASEWDVYGIVNSGSFDFRGAQLVKCDITNYIEFGNCIDDIEPDAVVHAAALADANFCQNNRELSLKVNVEAAVNIVGICSDFQIPFAFTSTDLVFDGKKGMYKENDAKNPVNVYGEHKAMAEDEVLKIYPQSSVFRLSLMFGFPGAGINNYMKKLIAQIGAGETAALFNDEYRSVCGAKSISIGIMQMLESNAGIVHLGGAQRISRYEFGEKIVKAFGLPGGHIRSCSQKDVPMSAPRPADVSLDISKARSLDFSPLTADAELQIIAEGKYV